MVFAPGDRERARLACERMLEYVVSGLRNGEFFGSVIVSSQAAKGDRVRSVVVHRGSRETRLAAALGLARVASTRRIRWADPGYKVDGGDVRGTG